MELFFLNIEQMNKEQMNNEVSLFCLFTPPAKQLTLPLLSCETNRVQRHCEKRSSLSFEFRTSACRWGVSGGASHLCLNKVAVMRNTGCFVPRSDALIHHSSVLLLLVQYSSVHFFFFPFAFSLLSSSPITHS